MDLVIDRNHGFGFANNQKFRFLPKPIVNRNPNRNPIVWGIFALSYQYERQIESLVIPIIQIKLGNYGLVRYKTKIEVVLVPL